MASRETILLSRRVRVLRELVLAERKKCRNNTLYAFYSAWEKSPALTNYIRTTDNNFRDSLFLSKASAASAGFR
jgi:hypothetical protein